MRAHVRQLSSFYEALVMFTSACHQTIIKVAKNAAAAIVRKARGDKAMPQSKWIWTDVYCKIQEELLVNSLADLERQPEEDRRPVSWYAGHSRTDTDALIEMKSAKEAKWDVATLAALHQRGSV